MFEKNDKRRLNWLIDQFLENKIDAETFCDEFHECYGLELGLDALTPLEEEIFYELSVVANRFSPFEEDLIKYPGTYFTEAELRQKIIDTKNKLTTK